MPRIHENDIVAADPNLTMLITAGTGKNSSPNDDKAGQPIYLYDLERGVVVDTSMLRKDEKFIPPEPLTAQYFAIDEVAGGFTLRKFFAISKSGWKEQSFAARNVVSHRCLSQLPICVLLLRGGDVVRVTVFDKSRAAHQEVIAHWGDARDLIVDDRAESVAAFSDGEVRLIDVRSRQVVSAYKAESDGKVIGVRFGPKNRQILVISEFDSSRFDCYGVDVKTKTTVQIASFKPTSFFNGPIGSNLQNLFDADAQGEALVFRTDEGTRVFRVRWPNEEGSEFSVDDHGLLAERRAAGTSTDTVILAVAPRGSYLITSSEVYGTSGTTTAGSGGLFTWDLDSFKRDPLLVPSPSNCWE